MLLQNIFTDYLEHCLFFSNIKLLKKKKYMNTFVSLHFCSFYPAIKEGIIFEILSFH